MPSSSVELRRFTSRCASLSTPFNPSYENEDTFVSHTGPLTSQRMSDFSQNGTLHANRKYKTIPLMMHGRQRNNAIMPEGEGHGGRNDHLLKSGPLGLCNNPDCTTCPSAYKTKIKYYKDSPSPDRKVLFPIGNFHKFPEDGADGWETKLSSTLQSCFPIMNPHTKVVQKWNKFFAISCLVAIFVDPLFFFVLSAWKDTKCIVLNWSFATAVAAVRSVTDFIYFLHMVLQFRLAYVAPESRVVGTGDLVDQPKKIAVHYLRGFFALDLFVLLPLPQVMILAVIPNYVDASSANAAKDLLRATVLLQYIPRIFRVLPLLAGQSASGFIFESAWANFVINLLMFVLAGHVVGSCWYLFGLQRVNQCLHDACILSGIPSCNDFIDCGRGHSIHSFSQQPAWKQWQEDSGSSSCFSSDGDFQYGIYQQVVNLTAESNIVRRYIYSLFWGFQQISTLAGNLTPSYFEWEVLFTMAIIGLGLLLFALLIGNMQNFLLALGRRRLEMQLRRRDVEQWMSHRRLPEELRRQVKNAERFTWAATSGVDEEELIQNLPEDLQRDIRRHFFQFLKNVPLFSLMDEPILDAVYQKLRQALYIRGSSIFYKGGPVEKMVFIVRGKVESIGVDGNVARLSEGGVCGEELLTWYLENSSLNKEVGKIRLAGQRLISSRTVKCLTNVEAFALRAADLQEVKLLLSRFLRNPRVQAEIRYRSPYWRYIAAMRIQVAWRYRKKRLTRANTFKSSR